MTDPAPLSPEQQASADVSGVEVLNPAAQAVWDAAWQLSPVNCKSHEDRRRQQIAASLRAAADQVVPLIDDPEFFCGNCCERVVKQEREETRAALLAIATELENAQ